MKIKLHFCSVWGCGGLPVASLEDRKLCLRTLGAQGPLTPSCLSDSLPRALLPSLRLSASHPLLLLTPLLGLLFLCLPLNCQGSPEFTLVPPSLLHLHLPTRIPCGQNSQLWTSASQASSCAPHSSLHLPLGASTWTSLPKSSQQTDLESSPPSLFLLFHQWLVSSTSHANQ